MKKFIIAVAVVAALGGCATMPRNDYVNHMRVQDWSNLILKMNPGYAYCFAMSESEARVELNEAWQASISSLKITDEKIDRMDGRKYGQMYGEAAGLLYVTKHRDRFLKEALPEEQREKCNAILKEYNLVAKK